MSTGTTLMLLLGLLIVVRVPGYPTRELLMPDGAPVPEEDASAPDHQDAVAAASELSDDVYEDGDDDSDMYMEPDGAETSQQGRLDGAFDDRPVPVSRDSSTKDSTVVPTIGIVDETELGRKSADGSEVSEKNLESDSQNFFPSFARIFSNHRHAFGEQQQPQQRQQQQPQQQQSHGPNRFLGYLQRDRGSYDGTSSNDDQPSSAHPLLGSGNFGVIRGGTYYGDDKEKDEFAAGETLYNPYFHGLNSRAKENYYRNPKPQPVRGGDFFANFRDFADITAPPKSSFSHLSIVYANKNGTGGRVAEPRNIIETLRMLEEESSETEPSETPRKKLSSGKRKLMRLNKQREDKTRKSRMTIEPLLALS